MKKKSTILAITLFILLNAGSLHAQYFQNRYNFDLSRLNYKPEVLTDGLSSKFNYANHQPSKYYNIGIGFTRIEESPFPVDSFYKEVRFVRTNREGTTSQNFGYAFAKPTTSAWYHSEGWSVCEIPGTSSTPGYMVVGSVATNDSTGAIASGNKDALIVRIDANGSVKNPIRLNFSGGADALKCVIPSKVDSGYFYACGTSEKSAHSKVIVVKFKSNGVVSWANTYHFDGTSPSTLVNYCSGNSIAEDPVTGSLYIAGKYTASGNSDALLFKLMPATGSIDFVKKFNVGNEDLFNCVKITHSREIILCGATIPAGKTTSDLLLVKTDTTGTSVFSNRYEIGNWYAGYDLVERRNSISQYEYYITGIYSPGAGLYNSVCKVDATGSFIFCSPYALLYSFNDKAMGIDTVPDSSSPGFSIFSQQYDGTGMTFSDGYILKGYFNGAVCNETCITVPGLIIPVASSVTSLEDSGDSKYDKYNLISKRRSFSSGQDCKQNSISCGSSSRVVEDNAGDNLIFISLYPNPVQDQLTLTLSEKYKDATIEIYNQMGEKISNQRVGDGPDPSIILNVTFLPPGHYLLKVSSETLYGVKPFIKF